MNEDEKKEQQNISAPAMQKFSGDILFESWLKLVEDFGPSGSQQP